MKSMEQQIKNASFTLFMTGIAIIAFLSLSSCATRRDTVTGVPGPKGDSGQTGGQGNTGVDGSNGTQGTQGPQGYGAGLQVTQLSVGNPNCLNGGIQVVNFQDLNNNGNADLGEALLGLTYACNGADGATGSQGAAGTNGSNGNDGHDGATGATGSQGSQGNQGVAGQDGASSTFNIVSATLGECPTGGFDLTLSDSTHTQTETLCNGINGLAGQAGTNGANGSTGGTVTFNLVQAIMPCGASSSPWKETLLGLQGGQILSSFSETASGQNTRLAFIPNGSYVDTDSSGCAFTVTGNGVSTSDISWSGGGYSWTPGTGWVAHN